MVRQAESSHCQTTPFCNRLYAILSTLSVYVTRLAHRKAFLFNFSHGLPEAPKKLRQAYKQTHTEPYGKRLCCAWSAVEEQYLYLKACMPYLSASWPDGCKAEVADNADFRQLANLFLQHPGLTCLRGSCITAISTQLFILTCKDSSKTARPASAVNASKVFRYPCDTLHID
ncbi:hypothetical protein PMIN03_011642 [Paraphaeosphaeria minitans]